MHQKYRRLVGILRLLQRIFTTCLPVFAVICIFAIHTPLAAQIIRSRALLSSPTQKILSFPLLGEADWAALSERERLGVLQQIADAEMDAFGVIPAHVISGKLDHISEHYTSSIYRTAEHRIVIDERTLQGNYRFCVESLLHECRHAYQYSVIIMLNWNSEAIQNHAFFEEARRWKLEFSSDTDTYSQYYLQSVECDARSYAAQRLGMYCPDDENPFLAS